LKDLLLFFHFTPCWEVIEKVVTARTGGFSPVRGSLTAIWRLPALSSRRLPRHRKRSVARNDT
jgi:hypothetical protein